MSIFAREVAIASGGIPRLIEFCLGAMAELVRTLGSNLTLKNERDVQILVHTVLYNYYDKSAEAKRVRLPDPHDPSISHSLIDNTNMILILIQLLTRNEWIDTEDPASLLSFTVSGGKVIKVSVGALISRMPIYFERANAMDKTNILKPLK